MKKFLCLLLSSLMLLSLAACGNTTENSGETGTEGKAEQTEAATQDMSFTCELPEDLSFNNSEVHFITAKADGRDDEIRESGDGGVISQAVHDRNVLTEEMLKVKMVILDDGDGMSVASKVNRDIKGATGEFDIVVNGTYLSVTPAMNGQYLNLSDLPYINTDKHYWTQGYNDMVTFTDRNMQFLASGSAAISMFRLMYLTIYNKTLFEANKIPDLYETVRNGGWTLDYQYEISTNHYVDSDGNNKRSTGDSFGFVTGNIISVDAYPVSADVKMVIKDAETKNLIYNNAALDKLSDLCDMVQRLYNDESTYVFQGVAFDDVPKNDIVQTFAEGRSLMATIQFLKMEHNFEDLSAMSYGIAPMPKFSAEQPNYQSYVQDQVSSFGISAGVGSEERQQMCAAVLEALTYHSYKLVRPAYYETVLSARFMQDPQSKEILDMLFDSLYFDFSQTCSNIFGGACIRDNLRPLMSGKKNTIASSTKRWGSLVNKSLKKYNENFDKLYG